MRTLAFDTTGPVLTVGAAHDTRSLGRRESRAQRHRGNLLDQLIDDLLEEIGWTRNNVEGLGLLNTFVRLRLSYGPDVVVELDNLPEGGARVRIGGNLHG